MKVRTQIKIMMFPAFCLLALICLMMCLSLSFSNPILHSYYTSSFHHSKDREVAVRLDQHYYQHCDLTIGPHCKYHQILLQESVSYANLVDRLDRFIHYYRDHPAAASSKTSSEEDNRIIYVGIEAKVHFTLAIEEVLNKYFAERPFFVIENINIEKGHPARNTSAATVGDAATTVPALVPVPATADISTTGTPLIWIVFRLVPPALQRALSAFSSMYFPSSPKHCESHPLAVNMDSFGTWGNRFGTTYNHQSRFPETIFITFIGDHCKHHRGNRFATHDLCPHTLNKFECLFLPGTNCSLPQQLTVCEHSQALTNDYYIFTNTTESGEIVPPDTINKYREQSQGKSIKTLRDYFNEADYRRERDFGKFYRYKLKDIDLVSEATIEKNLQQDPQFADVNAQLYLWGLHYRSSTAFYVLMQESMRQSRISSYYGILAPNETCVAMHLRKDDRQIEDLNMKEWCMNHTNPKSTGRENMPLGTHNGKQVSYGVWMDYGCLYHIPYGYATLEHFINASLMMFPENRNIFIMTDDPAWLDKAVEKTFGRSNISHAHSLEDYEKTPSTPNKAKYPQYENLRLFTLAAKRNDRKYEANVEFWGSIELVRQCKGLVMHPGSAVGRFITLAACYRSGQFNYMHCPDLFDISGGERW